MTDTKLNILWNDFKEMQSTLLEDRKSNFERMRLKTIQDLAQAFVDYYNDNHNSRPNTLSLVVDSI